MEVRGVYAAGAASVAWFSMRRHEVHWSGTPAGYRSSPAVMRRFCGTCGTTLTFEDDTMPDELDLSIATLDVPDAVPPRDHLFVSQKPSWVTIGGSLPQFARRRETG